MSDVARQGSSNASPNRRTSAIARSISLFFNGIRRWAGSRFQRRNIKKELKNLPLVVLLTMLIWIWAEREQIVPPTSIPEVDLRLAADRDRVIGVKESKITIFIYGPKNGVQEVQRKLTRTVPPGIDLDLGNIRYGPNQSISILERIRDNPVFKENGVTVTNVSPAMISVDVDRPVEADIEVKLPPDIPNIAGVTFDPPKVHVRGPESVMFPKPQVFADLAEPLSGKGPGKHEFANVTLRVSPRDERIGLSQNSVKAEVDVKQANIEWTKNSMAIFVSGPPGVLQEYRVQFERDPSLANVKLIGPPDIILQMQSPTFTPQPRAVLDVDRSDAGEKRNKHLRFEDLPKGVTVSAEDARREVEFRLVPRE